MQLAGRKALVVGLGKSGVAAARLLAARGASVAVADDKKREELETARRELADAERDLADLPEKARKAGALPGWIRE